MSQKDHRLISGDIIFRPTVAPNTHAFSPPNGAKFRSFGLLLIRAKMDLNSLLPIYFLTGKWGDFAPIDSRWVTKTLKPSYMVWKHYPVAAQRILIPRR